MAKVAVPELARAPQPIELPAVRRQPYAHNAWRAHRDLERPQGSGETQRRADTVDERAIRDRRHHSTLLTIPSLILVASPPNAGYATAMLPWVRHEIVEWP